MGNTPVINQVQFKVHVSGCKWNKKSCPLVVSLTKPLTPNYIELILNFKQDLIL